MADIVVTIVVTLVCVILGIIAILTIALCWPQILSCCCRRPRRNHDGDPEKQEGWPSSWDSPNTSIGSPALSTRSRRSSILSMMAPARYSRSGRNSMEPLMVSTHNSWSSRHSTSRPGSARYSAAPRPSYEAPAPRRSYDPTMARLSAAQSDWRRSHDAAHRWNPGNPRSRDWIYDY